LVGWELQRRRYLEDHGFLVLHVSPFGAAPALSAPYLASPDSTTWKVKPYLLLNDGIAPSPISGEQAKPMRWLVHGGTHGTCRLGITNRHQFTCRLPSPL
jgi:hypothetical protein